MNSAARIVQQMRQAIEGGAWHGPALVEILDGVTSELAAAQAFTGANTIWDITLHLIATQKRMQSKLSGVELEWTPSSDWPPMPEQRDDAAWAETVEELVNGDRALRRAVSSFSDDDLDLPLVQGGSSAYNNFHGYIQHNLYHGAQIGILKKMQLASERRVGI